MANSASKRLSEYLALSAAHPEEFGGSTDGVRIALDRNEILEIESKVARYYTEKGWPAEWAEVGICYHDPYLRLLRDAVVFPRGRVAVHHRVNYGGNPSGAAVLPLMDDRIVLIRHFRASQ